MFEEGKLASRWTPNFYSQWTQAIRVIVDDEAKRELKEYPRITQKIAEAISAGKADDVAKYEKELAQLLGRELKDLEGLAKFDLNIEYKVAAEIDEICKRFDRLAAKGQLKELIPEINAIASKVKGLVDNTKNMWERTGDYVQNIQVRNINLAGQVGAIRKLLTPMVLLARQQRQLTKVVLDFAQEIEGLELKIGCAEDRKDEVGTRRIVRELKQMMSRFDKNLKDEFDALTGLRMYSLYLVMVVSMHIHGEIVKLHDLVQKGYPETRAKELEDSFKSLMVTRQEMENRLMWLEKSAYQEVSKVFDHLQKDAAELQNAA
jgi:hypothetical protein